MWGEKEPSGLGLELEIWGIRDIYGAVQISQAGQEYEQMLRDHIRDWTSS